MADYKVDGASLSAIADAIRTKGSTSAPLSFPDGFVTAIGDIPTGEQPTLVTKTIATNGVYNASSDNADGYSQVTVAVDPAIVSGTFKGTTEGSLDVTIQHIGIGYPVMCIVYPTDGIFTSGSDFASLVQNKATAIFAMVKCDSETAPTYNDNSALTNKASVISQYKYSDSDPAVHTGGANSQTVFYRNENAGTAWNTCLRFKTDTTMAVNIVTTGNGFAKDIEYTYWIVYSS